MPASHTGTRAPGAGFAVSARIRNRAGYDRVFAEGQRHGHPLMVLHVLPGVTSEARLGLAVSRKVDPRAVGRNRIKRVLREHFRRLRCRLMPADVVMVARPAARDATPTQLRDAFERLLRKAGALPPSPPPGTMPGPLPDSPVQRR